MPHRKRKVGGMKKTSNARMYGGSRHHGAGFWGDVWDTVKKVAQPVNKLLKDTGIISKGLKAFGQNGLGSAAEKLGYGHRRKKHRGGALYAVKF